MKTFIENAIKGDDLSQKQFMIHDPNIINTDKYKKTMTEIANISRTMKWVQNYDNYPTRKFEYPFSYFATESFKPKLKVLDAGCSTDPFAPFLASKGLFVSGVDNFQSHDVQWDPEQGLFKGNLKGIDRVKVYKKNLKSRLNISVNYYKEDMCNLHFDNNYFDRIFCVSVLEHLPNYKIKMVFDEFRRVLKQNGYLILTIDYIVKGKPKFNIGKTLNEVGFLLIDKVNIFYVNDHPVTIAGFVIKSSKHNITTISKLYRRCNIVRYLTDKFYNKITKAKRLSNKFLK